MKITIKLLCCLLLFQLTVALPSEKRDADVAVARHDSTTTTATRSSSSSEEISPFENALKSTLTAFTTLIKYIIDDGVKMFQHTVVELKKLPNRSGALEANITTLNEFVNKHKDDKVADYTDDFMKAFEALGSFITIMDDYKDMIDSELKQQLKTALDASGYTTFEDKFEEHLKGFAKDFRIAVAKLIEDNDRDKLNEKYPELIKWYEKSKTEQDEEKKTIIYGEIFEIILNTVMNER